MSSMASQIISLNKYIITKMLFTKEAAPCFSVRPLETSGKIIKYIGRYKVS